MTNAPASVPLYDAGVLRTLFLDFEDKDWEAEMADFNNTDVEVPATLTVDGKKYPGVGVHFRGMSSFMGVRAGSKRSINLAIDFVDPKQRLFGYKTLNLLNAHEDPSFLGTVLYSHIARKHIPAPKANLVRLVINGENWGVYPSVQQFNNDFLKENYDSKKGARWKVRGSPGGQGGLEYLGDNVEEYKRRYDMKSGTDKDWQALIEFCKTLNKTPPDKLEEALTPICDLDGALWFLALDNGLINCDGYWIRSSDYSVYLDEKGKFHFIPHDMNEAFRAPMGPGMRGGQAGSGSPVELHPLVGIEDKQKPLRSKLLAVPSLKAKYLEHVAAVGDDLDWKNLGPVVAQYRALIEKEIEADTKKLSTFAEFQKATADTVDRSDAERAGRRNHMSLRDFAEQRSRYLHKFKKGETAPELPKELAAGPGGPGGFGPVGPGGFGPGTFMAPMLLESADKNTDKKLSKDEILSVVTAFAAQVDPDKTGSMDQAKLAAALVEVVPGPPGGGRGEGPSAMFAGAIFAKADANEDGKLVAGELATLVDALFKEWDKNTSGALEEAELAGGMNAALPRPFGPPGGPDGGGPPPR